MCLATYKAACSIGAPAVAQDARQILHGHQLAVKRAPWTTGDASRCQRSLASETRDFRYSTPKNG